MFLMASRDPLSGGRSRPTTLNCSFNFLGDVDFFLWFIAIEIVDVPSSKIKSCTAKENHIGSAFTEILRYRPTDTDPVTFV